MAPYKCRVSPNWVPRKLVRAWLLNRTGTLVSEQRIGRWLSSGELRTVKVPCMGGYKHYVTKESLEDVIKRNS